MKIANEAMAEISDGKDLNVTDLHNLIYAAPTVITEKTNWTWRYKSEIVPQSSVLGPFLYTLYTADIPQSPHIVLSTFADDTAILSSHSNPVTASANLQTHLLSMEKWTRKWKIKINEEKSQHVTFSLRRGNWPHLTFKQTIIPRVDEVKYLGLHLDRRLTWNCHISTLRKHLDLKTKDLYWIIGKHSPLSLTNKLLIYKVILKPVWTYGIELWGCASSSHTAKIQIPIQTSTAHNKCAMVCYKSNSTPRPLHSDGTKGVSRKGSRILPHSVSTS